MLTQGQSNNGNVQNHSVALGPGWIVRSEKTSEAVAPTGAGERPGDVRS